MSNFNKVIIVGNLTRDPELRYTAEGTPVGKMRLAVNRRWTSRDGDGKEETSFFNVTSFGKSAELIAKYLAKGNPILVDGRLRSYSFENEEGKRISNVEVVMEGFQFLPRGRRRDDEEEEDFEPLRTGTDG